VPVAPYNARNTDDPKDIEYRVEARIDEHSEDVQLKQSTPDETYNRRSGVERTNDAVKDCGLGHVRARGRVHARAQVFSRCAFVSLLRSPTTNAETIQEAPSSRHENYGQQRPRESTRVYICASGQLHCVRKRRSSRGCEANHDEYGRSSASADSIASRDSSAEP